MQLIIRDLIYRSPLYIIDIDFVYKFMYWFYIGWNDEVTFL